MLQLQSQSKTASKKSSLKSKKRKIRSAISGITFEQNETSLYHEPEQSLTKKTAEPIATFKENRKSIELSECKGPRYSFSTDIPETYQDFYLCALPRDPQWLYVYWEFPDETKGHHKLLSAQSDNAQWILRLKTTSDTEVHKRKVKHFDVPINIVASNWYVKIPEPGTNYNVECGQLSKDGHFTPHSMAAPFSVPSPVVNKPSDNDLSYEQTETLINFSNNTASMMAITERNRSGRIPENRASHFSRDEKRYFGSGCE
jgi:hypothetical protein